MSFSCFNNENFDFNALANKPTINGHLLTGCNTLQQIGVNALIDCCTTEHDSCCVVPTIECCVQTACEDVLCCMCGSIASCVDCVCCELQDCINSKQDILEAGTGICIDGCTICASVDSVMSDTSENPVMNCVVNQAISCAMSCGYAAGTGICMSTDECGCHVISVDMDQSYDPLSNKPQSGTAVAEALCCVCICVDQTYDSSSCNPQSGTAVAEALSCVCVCVDQTYICTSCNAQSGTAVCEAIACKLETSNQLIGCEAHCCCAIMYTGDTIGCFTKGHTYQGSQPQIICNNWADFNGFNYESSGYVDYIIPESIKCICGHATSMQNGFGTCYNYWLDESTMTWCCVCFGGCVGDITSSEYIWTRSIDGCAVYSCHDKQYVLLGNDWCCISSWSAICGGSGSQVWHDECGCDHMSFSGCQFKLCDDGFGVMSWCQVCTGEFDNVVQGNYVWYFNGIAMYDGDSNGLHLFYDTTHSVWCDRTTFGLFVNCHITNGRCIWQDPQGNVYYADYRDQYKANPDTHSWDCFEWTYCGQQAVVCTDYVLVVSGNVYIFNPYETSCIRCATCTSSWIDITPSGGGCVCVDQTYDASSCNAQSGTAVAEALSTVPTVAVDQTYDASSCNAQSGTAVAEAIATVPTVTVDQTYDASSSNAQSGTAVAEAISCVCVCVNPVPACDVEALFD